jgi:hypothetical protein
MRFAIARASTLITSKVAQPSSLDGRGEDEYSVKARGEGRVAEALPVDYVLPDSPALTRGASNLERSPQFWRWPGTPFSATALRHFSRRQIS